MHFPRLFCLALAFASLAMAATSQPDVLVAAPAQRLVMKETSIRRMNANGWQQIARAPATVTMSVLIFVKHADPAPLLDTLYAVSDPRSPNYGQHLTLEQVNKLVAPAPASLSVVLSWLKGFGIGFSSSDFTPRYELEANGNQDTLRVTLPVSVLEEMLHTQYHIFVHSTGTTAIRTLEYYLPETVATHIDFMSPTVRFPPTHQLYRNMKRVADTNASLGVNPTFLRSLYSLGSTTSTSAQNKQGVAAFLEQYFSPSDLSSFLTKYAPLSKVKSLTVVGPNDDSNPGIETMLDVEYIMSMGANAPTEFWYTPGRQPGNSENEPFEQWLFNVGNATNAPWVFSISYGDNEDSVLVDYANRVNIEFQKAGARGLSIMASSGDGGVGGSQPSGCTTFIPNFPASSPFVTAVGGTTGSSPEVGAGLSSGGFSNYFARPSYQDDAVNNYFSVAHNLPSPNLYNKSGAGFPDVSAQAEGFVICVDGFYTSVDGTSCSSPTFTGVMSLLNDARFQAGKSSLGWLNPLFYQHPEVFTDITSGNNPGCNSAGFYAAKGWDPITGLGSPNFSKLLALVQSLP